MIKPLGWIIPRVSPAMSVSNTGTIVQALIMYEDKAALEKN